MTAPTTPQPDDTFDEKQLAFVKFILENGGISRNRSEDDAKSILRYYRTRISEAEAAGALRIIGIYSKNGTLTEAAYADCLATIASWRLARQATKGIPLSKAEYVAKANNIARIVDEEQQSKGSE